MKVLITGNLGYIGTVLGQYLFERDFEVLGLDSGYYKECLLDESHKDIATLIRDIRDVEVEDLKNFDAIVHLAALSNDPIGELDSRLTYDINRDASIKLAEMAQQARIARFVFISTQSIYGVSTSDIELVESELKNPQTAYARSKWEAEQSILQMANSEFTTVALRPSTVFGWSPRLRSDIVFNNLLLSGLTKGKIEVHSDGSPWRPIVHVTDLCESIRLALLSPAKDISGKSINIGKIGGNYTVKEIASAAAICLGDIETVFNTENITDARSYKVSFQKALEVLKFEADRELVESGDEMLTVIKALNLEKIDLMGRKTNRLAQVAYLRKGGQLDESLRFK